MGERKERRGSLYSRLCCYWPSRTALFKLLEGRGGGERDILPPILGPGNKKQVLGAEWRGDGAERLPYFSCGWGPHADVRDIHLFLKNPLFHLFSHSISPWMSSLGCVSLGGRIIHRGRERGILMLMLPLSLYGNLLNRAYVRTHFSSSSSNTPRVKEEISDIESFPLFSRRNAHIIHTVLSFPTPFSSAFSSSHAGLFTFSPNLTRMALVYLTVPAGRGPASLPSAAIVPSVTNSG